jgi:hypothetical protein
MTISNKEIRFLQERRKLNRYGYIALSICAVGFICGALYLVIKTPNLINPFAFMESFSNGEVENSTVILMAALLPLMTLTLFVTILAMLLISLVVIRNERKLLLIVDSLQKMPNQSMKADEK